MNKSALKQFFLLSLPIALLLGFGFTWSAKPILRLRSVKIKPAISSITGEPKQGAIAVDVYTEYYNPSLSARLSEEPGLWFNLEYGLYVEDEHGVKYGKGHPPQDMKTYRPFVDKFGGSYGIGGVGIEGDPYAWSFHVPINKIPASAGKLTLKTILESGNSDAPTQLPIAIVVRQ